MLKRTQGLFSHWFGRNARAAVRQRQVIKRRKSFLEPLEGRNLLATFYVALTGSDANTGGTADPFRTIQAAITAASNTSDGPDIVNVAGGVYNTALVDERFTIGNSASPPAGLTNLQLQGGWNSLFTVRNPAATPTDYTFTNSVTPATRYDIPVYQPNTTIDGFTFRSSDGTTPRESDTLQVETTNVTFSNNIVYVGIRNGGTRPAGVVTSTLNNSIAGLQILNNQFNANFSGSPTSNTYALGVFLNPTSSTGVTISGNTFQGNNFAAMLVVSSVSGVTIDSNTFVRSAPSGFQVISVREPVNPPGAISNISITNNQINGGGISPGIQIGESNAVPGSTLPLSGITISGNSISNSTAAIVIGPGSNQQNAISASISGNTFTSNGSNIFYSSLGAGGSTTVNGASVNPGSNSVSASTTANQNFKLVRNGSNLEVYDITVPASPALILSQAIGTAQITIQGADNFDNTLTVDFTGGNPIPSGGLAFAGGAAGNDKLVISGGSTTTVKHTLTNASDGSVTLTGALAGTISYTGLEPVTDNISAANRVFDFTGAAETITVSTSPVLGFDNRIDSTLSESVDFTNPTDSLQIITTTGGGADTVTISSISATYRAATTISTDGDDNVNLNTSLTLGNGAVTGAFTIAAANAVSLAGSINTDNGTNAGNINITGPITLGANVTLDTDQATGTDGSITLSGTVNADSAASNRTLTMVAGGGTVTATSNVGASQNLQSYTISSASSASIGRIDTRTGGISVTGTNVTLGGNLSADGLTTSGPVSITGAISLGAGVTIDADNTGTDGAITITGTVNGAQSLVVNSGTANSSISAAVGGTVPLTSLTATAGDFNATAIATSGTLSVTNTGTASAVSGVISGVALAKNGAGTLVLSGTNTYTGITNVNAGVLNIQNVAALGATSAGTVVTTGAALQLQGGLSFAAEPLQIEGDGAGGANGALRNINGSNTWTGPITASYATTSTNTRIGIDGTTSLTISSNINIAGVSTNQFVFQASGNATASGIISGGAGFTKSSTGTGTLTLTGANTYTGTTTVSNGNLQIGNGGTTGTLGTAGVSLASGTVLIFNRTNLYTVANVISGAGSVQQTGAGTTALTGANSYTGPTTINAGVLEANTLANGGSNSSIGAATNVATNLVINGGTLRYTGPATSTDRAIDISAGNGSSTLDASGSGLLSWSGNISGAHSLTLRGTGSGNFSGVYNSTAGTLNKNDAGTWTLSGANIHTIATAIAAGTLIVTNASGLGTAALGTTVASGATLDVRANIGPEAITSVTGTGVGGVGALITGSGSGTVGGAVTLVGATTIGGAGALTISGSISGAFALTKDGAGTTVLAGSNGHTTTTISAGTLQIGSGGAAGTLGSGAVTNNGTLAFNRNDAITIGNGVTGSGVINQTGAGTTTLTNTNSASGGTNVTSGVLAVNGSLTSNVVVTSPGALNGSGTITGNVSGNGTFSPGNSPGTMTIIGNFTPSGTVNFEVNSPWTTAGTDFDRYNVTGTVNLTGATLTFTNTLDASAPSAQQLLTLIDNDTAADLTTAAAGPADGATVTIGSRSFRLFYNGGDGNNVVLVDASTPTTVYVEDTAWNSLTSGTVIADADFGTTVAEPAVYGVNAFNTITAALAAVTNSGTVIINGGTYAEAVVSNNTKTLKVTGLNTAQAVVINSVATAAGQNVIIDGASTLTIGDGTSTTIAGVISGSGSLIKQGAGTLTLSGPNTYTGSTTVSVGTLQLGNATALGTTAGSTSVTSGAVLDLNGQTVGAEQVTLNGTGIASGGALINSSASAASLAGTIPSSTYSVGGTGNITLSGAVLGTLTKVSTNSLTLSGTTDNGGLAVVASGGTTILAKTSTGSVHAIGTAGTGLTINSGATVQLAGSGGDQIYTQADVLINAGGILDLNGQSEGIDGLSGAGNLRNTGAAATLTVGQDNTTSAFTGTLGFTPANGFALTKVGTGTLTLSGANTYTGGTTLTAGQITTSNSAALGTGTLTMNGGTLNTSVDLANNVTLNNTTNTIAPNNNYRVMSGQFSGAGGFIVANGGGTPGLELNNTTNNFAGNVTINSGTYLKLSASEVLPNTATVTDNGNLRLDVAGGGTETIAGLTGTNTGSVWVPLTNSATHTLLVGAGNTSSSFAGTVGAGGQNNAFLALTKTGSGTFTLTNAGNVYGGVTTVNDGTLQVDGAITGSGTVTVNNSAILAGNGSIAGAVNLNNTSRLAPGGSPESLATGSLTFVAGTFFDVQIGGTTPITQYDQVNVTGTVTLANATLNLQQISGFTINPAVIQQFVILTNDGVDPVVGTFNGLAEGATLAYAGGTVYVSYAGGDGNDIVLYSNPTVNGSPGADTFVLRQLSGTQNEYSLNGTPFVPVTNTLPITFNGLGGTDLLLVDTSNGDPIPTGGVGFNGELLRVQKNTGVASDSLTYVPSASPGIGTVSHATFGDILYAGTTNVDFVNVTTVNVQTPTVNDTLTIADGNTATNGGTVPGTYSIVPAASLNVSGADAVIGLRNVTNVNVTTVTGGGDGNDSVTMNTSTGEHGVANFALTTGAGTDTVTVAGPMTVTGNINLSSQNIAVNATLTAGGTNSVTLNAGTGAITTSGAGIDVVAQDLIASATTGIDLDTTVTNITATSSGAGNVIIDETNGANVLSVSAGTGSATVTSATGNLSVTTVSASTSVTLTATAGQIIDANGATNNITGSSLTATAQTGIDLDTTIGTLTSASVTGTGAIDINDSAGGLIVTSATTADGAITLNATGGDLTLTSVIAGGTGRNISATTTTSGNILVALVDATGDNLTLTAAAGGAINETAADATADLVAATATLTGPAGIGNLGTIEVDFTTLTSASTTGVAGAIDLSDLAGGLVVTSATTTDGAITLNATGGDLTLTSIIAGGAGRNVTATTTTSGNMLVALVDASGDTLTLTAVGSISETATDAAVDLLAATATLSASTGIGSGNSLETSFGTLTATNSTSANIEITETDAITLSSVVQSTDNDANDILITAGGTITIGVVNAGTASGDVTLTATAGSIIDNANDATADVIGDVVTLTAVAGVGESAGNGSLDTTANSLDVSVTAAGLINLAETNAVTLTDIDTQNGPITITAGGTITATDVASITDNDANDISITASSGNIILGLVTAGPANGDVTLIATTGTIIDNTNDAAVDVIGDFVTVTAASAVGESAGNGSIDTTANSLDVSVTSAGSIFINETNAVTLVDVDTANGAITILAAGTITATDVASLTDNDANDIAITATTGDIIAGVITAGTTAGDVTLLATTGSIVDDTLDAVTDVTGDVLIMTAANGVGQAAGNGSLDTAANSLDVSVTAAGLINLNELNAVTLTDIDTVNGPITIVAGGTITATDVASLTDSDANDITLTATAGNIAVGTVIAGAAGDVFLTAAAAITDIDATNPDITADDIVLLAGSGVATSADPLETVSTNLESSGGTGGVFVANTGTLTIGGIGATVGLSATGGDIVVTTTGGINVTEDVTATGAGTDVTLTAIDAVAAGQNIVVNGGVTVSSDLASVMLNAGDNATITGNISSGTITTINVDFGDAESVAPTATAGDGGTLTITGSITTPNTAAGGAYLNGGNDYDTFTFNPQTTTAFYVDGDLPVGGIVGDVLQMDVTGTVNPNLTVPGNNTIFNGKAYNGPGSGKFAFDPNHREVRFKSIEDSQITGPYHLTYDNSVAPVGNLVVMLDGGVSPNEKLQFRDGSVGGTILYQTNLTPILSVRVLGGAGADMVTIDDINGLPSFAGSVPASTGVGNNTFISDTDATPLPEFFFDAAGGTNTLNFNLNRASTLQQWALGTGTGPAGSNEGEVQSTNATTGLNAYVRNVNEINRTGIGATPGGLTVFGDDLLNSLSIANNGGGETRIAAPGYPSFDFSGNNYTSFVVNGQASGDTIDLISFGTAQNNNWPITLNGNTGDDTIRVRSTSGNTNTVSLNGNAGDDTFQLYDGTTTAGTVDNIAGLVVVDGTDGNVANNTDTLTIIDNSDASADSVLVSPVNPTVNADYAVEGINNLVGNDVTFRNVDVLNYTGTLGNDLIDGQFRNTTPTQHDLSIVTLNGWSGADQFLLFETDQIGGTGVGFTPTGTASGVSQINLNGDAPGNPNAGDGNDIFGQTPAGIIGTGVMNVGLVVSSDTRMIRPSATTGLTINGGEPTGLFPPAGDQTGDRLNLDITSLPNTNPVIVSTFLPGTVVATGIAATNWSQIEDMNLVDQNKLTNVQMGDLFARTTPSQDLIQLSRNATTANPSQVRLRINATIGNYSASNKTIMYSGGLNDTITQADLTIPAEFYGEDGNDSLSGGIANDWLVGGLGNDRINGSRGDNVIWGDNSPTLPTDPQPQDLAVGGDDVLSGLEGADVFYGGGGNDQVSGGAGNDYAYGGQGDDALDGHDGDDRLYGGTGNDVISGYTGNDLLVGNTGDDKLYGQEGNDVLFGGAGADLLDGGLGNDLIVSGSVGNENSSWTSLASTGTYSAATYTNPMDNDAALVTLLAQWGSLSDRSSIGSITHDGDNDDLFGGLADDDFCWELADVQDNPPGISPPDFNAIAQGNDERFGPT